MLAITFIFGFLVSVTFGWFVVCLYYLNVSEVVINTPYDVFMVVMTVSMPPLLLWIVASLIYNSVFIRKLVMFQSFLTAELRKNSEIYNNSLAKKEGFKIIEAIPTITTCLNNILAGIFVSLEIISMEDLSRLWRMVGSGDNEALAREFIKRINKAELRARALKSDELKAELLRFCERYDRLLNLIEKYDSEKIIGESFEVSDYSKIYIMFSGISVKNILHRAEDTEDKVLISVEKEDEIFNPDDLNEDEEKEDEDEKIEINSFKEGFDFIANKSDFLHKYKDVNLSKEEEKND
ncbi:MAG: hypothetical protein BWY78_00713 [Alphaproteobacteria bacterium ADurb.Bin438]|nr:MAG: hypothetical protein BWY78_00713 [Alphaproteobacteria bacterium ADurb.Bin438]